jgi:hypothetical protein
LTYIVVGSAGNSYLVILSILLGTVTLGFVGSFECTKVQALYSEFDISRYFCISDVWPEEYLFGLPHISELDWISGNGRLTFSIYFVTIFSLLYASVRAQKERRSCNQGRTEDLVVASIFFSMMVLTSWGQYGLLNFAKQFTATILCFYTLVTYKREATNSPFWALGGILSIYIHSSVLLVYAIYFAGVILEGWNHNVVRLLRSLKLSKSLSINVLLVVTLITGMGLAYMLTLSSSYQYLWIANKPDGLPLFKIMVRVAMVIFMGVPIILCWQHLKAGKQNKSTVTLFGSTKILGYSIRIYGTSLALAGLALCIVNTFTLLSERLLLYSEWLALLTSVSVVCYAGEQGIVSKKRTTFKTNQSKAASVRQTELIARIYLALQLIAAVYYFIQLRSPALMSIMGIFK